jgi:hypothetical protein
MNLNYYLNLDRKQERKSKIIYSHKLESAKMAVFIVVSPILTFYLRFRIKPFRGSKFYTFNGFGTVA